METDISLFWRKVRITPSCWHWDGSRNPGGYGRVKRDGRLHQAHRYVFEHFEGPIAAGLEVLHSCDNPSCVNPAHLSLGTHAQNMADMVEKQRSRSHRMEAHPMAKLTAEQARGVFSRVSGGETKSAIARDLGVSRTLLRHILQGRLWAPVTVDLRGEIS